MTPCKAKDLENNTAITKKSDVLKYQEMRVVSFERKVWQQMGYFNGWAGFDTNPTIDRVPDKYKEVTSMMGVTYK
jgi:hypothetical protein